MLPSRSPASDVTASAINSTITATTSRWLVLRCRRLTPNELEYQHEKAADGEHHGERQGVDVWNAKRAVLR
jgi:hypothetical protein